MNVGIPPRSLNHRLPAACDAPTATAAPSLLNPLAISCQNSRSTSRRNDGAPGDLNGALPVNSRIHPAGLPIHTSTIKVLRGPVESAQYVSGDYTQTLADHDVLASVGSTGDAYDNSMAESFVDSFKTELITDRVWRTRSQLELAIVEYISWFNDSRLHENLDDRPPREIEELYAAKDRATTTTT
jgi:putative transposase